MLASQCAKCGGFVIRECLDPASVCLMCGKQVWDSPGDPIPKGKRHCDPKQPWYYDPALDLEPEHLWSVEMPGHRAKRQQRTNSL